MEDLGKVFVNFELIRITRWKKLRATDVCELMESQ